VASYPFLSRLAIENKFNEMNLLLNSIIMKIGIYLIPICGMMMVLSTQIIAILFQHGRFTRASTMATAPVLVLYLVGAFPFAASTIIMRNYYAMQNTLFPMIISTLIALVSIPCYWLLSKGLGARGIALTASIAMLVQSLLLYWIWSFKHGNMPDFLKTAGVIAKVSAISALGAYMCYLIKLFLFSHGIQCAGNIQNLLLITASGTPSIIFVFLVLEVSGISNTRVIIQRLLKRSK
jgi:putative peptidoglycan lipid II flippase